MTASSRRASLLASVLVLSLCVACGGPGDRQASAAATPAADAGAAFGADARSEGKKVFEPICWTCHGMSGHGDGPASAGLEPKPRNLGDAAWQKTVTDEHIRNVVTMGGAAVGKSPAMPAQPQLKGNQAVLDALIAHVRSLAQ